MVYRGQGMLDAILPPRTLDKRLQENWVKDVREDLRILMNLRVDFEPMD